jgi:anti-sigma-K factor RskA
MTDHEQYGELAAAYGLDALDAAERAAFERHLSSCAQCQQVVAETQQIAATLPHTLAPVEPPAALRARIMMTTAPAKQPTAPAKHPAAPAVQPVTAAIMPPWLAVAAAIIAVVAGATAWTQYQRAGASQVAASQSQAQVEALQAQLTAMQTQAETARRAVDILAADDLTRVDLKGQPAAPAASGRAYWSATRGLMFSAIDLPALPAGRVYQLWYVTAAAPVSAALVNPDAAGRFTLIAGAPAGIKPTAMAVTIEPAGGLPAPTGAFYLLGTF